MKERMVGLQAENDCGFDGGLLSHTRIQTIFNSLLIVLSQSQQGFR
ncbi:MAG: hypothetical protein ABFS56_33875 [Pseudomonadota bacterium]